MEGVEPSLLARLKCPGLTTIKEGAEDTCFVHSCFGVSGQLFVFPNSFGQSGESRGYFANASADLSVHVEVVPHCGAQVSELMDNMQYAAMTEIDGGCSTSWAITLVFLILMVIPKSWLAREKLSMSVWSCCSVRETRAASSSKSMSLINVLPNYL